MVCRWRLFTAPPTLGYCCTLFTRECLPWATPTAEAMPKFLFWQFVIPKIILEVISKVELPVDLEQNPWSLVVKWDWPRCWTNHIASQLCWLEWKSKACCLFGTGPTGIMSAINRSLRQRSEWDGRLSVGDCNRSLCGKWLVSTITSAPVMGNCPSICSNGKMWD